eukprot:g19287.t1
MEHGVRLTKTEHLFFTGLSSSTLGGVPGMMLTMAEIKEANSEGGGRGEAVNHGAAMTLHGPPGLSEFYTATRHFMHHQRAAFPVAFEAVETTTTFRHDEMTVFQVPITKARQPPPTGAQRPRSSNKRPREEAESGSGVEGHGATAEGGAGCPRESVLLSSEARRHVDADDVDGDGGGGGDGDSGAEQGGGRGLQESGVGCVCYICEAPPLAGKFDVAKATALNVPHGPLFGNLQRGNHVVLPDGTVVKPEQVLGASKTGAPVLIVDCPSLDLLPSLVENPAWDRLYASSRGPPSNTTSHGGESSGGGGGGGGGPAMGGKKARKGKGEGAGEGGPKFDDAPFLVHMAPEEVLRSPAYGAWARRFGPTAKHLVATQPFCSPHSIFQASHDQFRGGTASLVSAAAVAAGGGEESGARMQ